MENEKETVTHARCDLLEKIPQSHFSDIIFEDGDHCIAICQDCFTNLMNRIGKLHTAASAAMGVMKHDLETQGWGGAGYAAIIKQIDDASYELNEHIENIFDEGEKVQSDKPIRIVKELRRETWAEYFKTKGVAA